MSDRNGYDPGTPSWVDLSTPDVDASARFYGELFGWEAVEAGPPEETGGYRIIMRDGKAVGGMMGLMDPNQPAVWSTYVAVDDADATARAVRDAGGTVLVEPMDVMDAGRMAFFMDPGGAAIGVWQAGTNKGAQVVNEPGAVTWNELQVRDPEAHKAFYSAVFGWTPEAMQQGPIDYTMWNTRRRRRRRHAHDAARGPGQHPAALARLLRRRGRRRRAGEGDGARRHRR